MAQHLIEAGAKIDQHNAHKLTPLHLTAQNGHYDLTEILLLAGADPNYPDLNGKCDESLIRQKCLKTICQLTERERE